MFGKMLAFSTVKHLSWNYASFQQPSVQEWYSLSTSGQTQSIFKKYRWLSWRWKLSCRTQASRKAYELLSWCVMLTLNTDVFKLILLSLKRKRHFTPYPKMLIYSVLSPATTLQAKHFLGRFTHALFPIKEFLTSTHIVTAVTPVTSHSRNR